MSFAHTQHKRKTFHYSNKAYYIPLALLITQNKSHCKLSIDYKEKLEDRHELFVLADSDWVSKNKSGSGVNDGFHPAAPSGMPRAR